MINFQWFYETEIYIPTTVASAHGIPGGDIKVSVYGEYTPPQKRTWGEPGCPGHVSELVITWEKADITDVISEHMPSTIEAMEGDIMRNVFESQLAYSRYNC